MNALPVPVAPGCLPARRLADPAFAPDPAAARAGWAAALRTAEHLQSSGAASKVWIWGSVMIASEFHPGSDLDLHIAWRPGVDRDEVWEQCQEVAHPYRVEFSLRRPGKSPLSHPIVRYRGPDQPLEPWPVSPDWKLRLLQDRMERRTRKLTNALRFWPGEVDTLRRHGLEHLIDSLRGFAWQKLREEAVHFSLKTLWLIDRRPIWALSIPEILAAAAREEPGLRPALLSPGLAALCTPEEAVHVSGDILAGVEEAVARFGRFAAFLSDHLDHSCER